MNGSLQSGEHQLDRSGAGAAGSHFLRGGLMAKKKGKKKDKKKKGKKGKKK